MCEFYFCKCTTKMAADLKAEDVKNKLFNTLKSRGVLDSLKVCHLPGDFLTLAKSGRIVF